MAKTEKELQELKEKIEEVNRESKELTVEELEQISGSNSILNVPEATYIEPDLTDL